MARQCEFRDHLGRCEDKAFVKHYGRRYCEYHGEIVKDEARDDRLPGYVPSNGRLVPGKPEEESDPWQETAIRRMEDFSSDA